MFFFNLADNPKLDHQGTSPEQYGFCVFGQVIDGLDVLDKLSAAKTGKVDGFTQHADAARRAEYDQGASRRDPQVQPAGYRQVEAVAPSRKSCNESDTVDTSNGAAIQR